MQRVRVGLTGLACVFLLVVLATAFLGMAGNGTDLVEVEAGNAAAASAQAVADNIAEEPREPLAELGVTPGNLPEEEPVLIAPPPPPPPSSSPPAAAPR
jgi:hypothetical protein